MYEVITHSGVGHADEIFAIATLKLALGEDQVKIARTRDPQVLADKAGAQDTFLLDVGGVYDAEKRLFDHHQKQGAGFRNMELNEWPYATAGLIWKHYGQAAVQALHPSLSDADAIEVVEAIDFNVIKYIDAVDCGVTLKTAGPSLSGIIASFNSSWYEGETSNFPLVTELALVLLKNFVNRSVGKVKAREPVRSAEKDLGGKLLVLPSCIPWMTVVAEEMPEVLAVAYPVNQGLGHRTWQVRVAMNTGCRLSNRIQLPEAWAGLEHQDLAEATGVGDAIFCHRSRHLMGATTYAGAVEMVRQAIEIHEQTAKTEDLLV